MMQRRTDWPMTCWVCKELIPEMETHWFGRWKSAEEHTRICMACHRAAQPAPPKITRLPRPTRNKKPAKPVRHWQAYGMSWMSFLENELACTGVQVLTSEGLLLIGDIDNVGNYGGLIIPDEAEVIRYRRAVSRCGDRLRIRP